MPAVIRPPLRILPRQAMTTVIFDEEAGFVVSFTSTTDPAIMLVLFKLLTKVAVPLMKNELETVWKGLVRTLSVQLPLY